jgi:hypothetical protein
VRTIGHEELKQMLDRQDDFRLVMALSEWAYQAKHRAPRLYACPAFCGWSRGVGAGGLSFRGRVDQVARQTRRCIAWSQWLVLSP